jgi:hypothetical protein
MCQVNVWSEREEKGERQSLLLLRFTGKGRIALLLSRWNKSRGTVPEMRLKAKRESNAFQTKGSKSRDYGATTRTLTEIYFLHKSIFMLARHVVTRTCAPYWHIRSSLEEICSVPSYRGWRWMVMANRASLLSWRSQSLLPS